MKNTKNDSGFTLVEALLVILILIVLSFAGYYVYTKHKASTKSPSASITTKPTSISSTTTQTADPYAGWKSYTTQYEKLTFKYPATWTVSDQSTSASKTDNLTIKAPDGFAIYFEDGIQNGGDPLPLVNSDPVTVSYLGKTAYLVYVHPKVAQANGPSIPDTSVVSYAILLTDPNNQASSPADKNVIGSSKYNGVNGPDGSYMNLTMGSNNSMSLAAAKTNPDFINGKLVVQSFGY